MNEDKLKSVLPASLLIVLLLAFGFLAKHQQPTDPDKRGPEAHKQRIFEKYGKLPMHFEANHAAKITPAQAKAIAVNRIEATESGVRLKNRLHSVDFEADGLHFKTRRSGLDWNWQMQFMGTEAGELDNVTKSKVAPRIESANSCTVQYHRGGVIEQYVAHVNSIEQQFVIPAPLDLGGDDLVIRGSVTSVGRFEGIPTPNPSREGNIERRWRWRSGVDVVSLGDVTVFDAAGSELPASMHVTANETRIAVNGLALASAAYPVTIDPEIGANDFRISDMGPDSNADFDGSNAAVAYNSTDNEYLVVWFGDDNTGSLVDNELEIYGQRLDAATGAELGDNDFRISDMGPDGDANFDAFVPAVAYNSADNEYLVVWSGDDNIAPLIEGENEIFGQRLTAAGVEIGSNDFRISDMGPDGSTAYGTGPPAVVYNSTHNEYLVVWRADDDTGTLVNNEEEIFGQRLDAATGAEVGDNDFRISDMGPDGNTGYGTGLPALAYNSVDNEYLVVWHGDDDTAPLVDNEREIFGQRLSASGAEIGTNDFRISDMGPDGSDDFNALNPAVAYNNADNEYLVVWEGDDDTVPLVDNESEIFGQRISAAGAKIGTNDFRISDMGPDGSHTFDAVVPSVAYNSANIEYLVVWQGSDNTGALVAGEWETFGQRLSAAGAEIGDNDFRLSDMGSTDGSNAFGVRDPAVAYNSANNEYLAVWHGEDDTAPLINDEFEIFGQRFAPGSVSCFWVTNTNDAGSGSLRQAILDANAFPNLDASTPDTIKFNVPGAGPHTIQPDSVLPAIIDPVIIDGTTQPGADCSSWPPTLLVELDGSNAGLGFTYGLLLDAGSDGSTIRGLVINRFAGNGLFIFFGRSIRVECNFIGTDVSGMSGLGNGNDGIQLAETFGNTIGGLTPDKANLISANASDGISISNNSDNNLVQGNLIGTSVNGSDALGNGRYGINVLDDSAGNLIGGTASGAANIIAYNASAGILVADPGSIGNAILGNTIHSNGGLGIEHTEDPDNLADGVTANDPGDSDTGPNNLQNFPVITSAATDGGSSVTVAGTLNSTPNTNDFRLEFFANTVCNGDVDGQAQTDDYGEGETFIGFTTVSTNGSGDASFSVNLSADVAVGEFITATATAPDGSTSEFSQCVAATAEAPELTIINDLIQKKSKNVKWNSSTNQLSFDIAFKNISGTPISDIQARIDELNPGPPTITVNNADNNETGLGAIFDYSDELGADDLLSPSETSGYKTWIFDDPSAVNFTFFANILGSVSGLSKSAAGGERLAFHASPASEEILLADGREPEELLPEQFSLEQNYPNPFNPETKIRFALPLASNVELVVYNLLGQEINTLVNEDKAAGSYDIIWNGRDKFGQAVASGIYIYRIIAGEFSQVKKLTLVR